MGLIILNSIFYFILFLYHRLKYKEWNIASSILLVWFISSAGSIAFFLETSYYTNISLVPYIYLFSLFILCIHPLYSFNSSKVKTINTTGASKFIFLISIFFALSGILPAIELTIIGIKNLGDLSQFASVYEGDNIIFSEVSWIGRKFNFITLAFNQIIVILFFYFVSLKKTKYNLIILGLGISMINPAIYGFAAASRGLIVSDMMSIYIGYLLFKNLLNIKTRKKINKIGIISGGVLATVFVLITISRYNFFVLDAWGERASPFRWLSLYIGESQLNFNHFLWNTAESTNGDYNFSLLKSFFGEYRFDSRESMLAYYNNKLGIPTFVFYTFIGTFFHDLGIFFTPILCLFLSIVLKINTKSKKGIYSLEKITIIALISKLYFMGFTNSVYSSYSSQVYLIMQLLVILMIGFARDIRSKHNANI